MKTHRPFNCTVCVFLLFVSCATAPPFIYQQDQAERAVLAPYPPVVVAVLTDPHLHSPELGITGKAFWNEVLEGKKLLQLSDEILVTALDQICADPDIKLVFICGDLTKDGEQANHHRVKTLLEQVEAKGKKVYVVPGNHDVLNPGARRYSDTGSVAVPSVSPAGFAALYENFGYGEAIARDPASLSYVAEPLPGLWLFALDACTYDENKDRTYESTYGKFKEETLEWIEANLIEANHQGKTVMGMMHHGILEHFASQKKYFPEYVVEDNDRIASLLAHYGMRFVFTGHFHAQDISKRSFADGSFLFDVETSSLVTYPCAYRVISIQPDGMIDFTAITLTSLPSTPDFATVALDSLRLGVSAFLERKLAGFDFSPVESQKLIPQLIAGLVAHTRGDEVPPPVLIDTQGLSLGARLVVMAAGDLVEGAWHDGPPPDNNLKIDSEKGAFFPKE